MGTVETVSVVFTDLVGSTALSAQVGPTAAEALRQEHFALLREAIADTGGREVKNLDDGLMVVFTSAVAAVDCAVRMQQRIELRNRRAEEQLSVRIGIGLGDASCEDGDYFGPPVVEAARLCASAAGDQVLCHQLVRMMAGDSASHSFESIGRLALEGVPEQIEAFHIHWEPSSAASAAPLPVRLRGIPPASYVGRDVERETLDRMAAEASKGEIRVALISGEPGIGKTRIATYAALSAHGRGAAVLYGRCDEDLRIPYQPWLEALREFLAYIPDELLEANVERHGGELRRLLPDLTQRLPHIPEPRSGDPESQRYMLYGAITDLLAATSATQPIVLIFDDLHWADRESLSLLKHVVSSSQEISLLLIGTFRDSDIARGDPLSELLIDLRQASGVERVTLSGLAMDEVAAMIEGAAGHKLAGEGLELARVIARETGGNPFFVAEMGRHLLETGGIRLRSDGRWSVSGTVAELGLPESIRELVGRRVDRLGDKARRALSVAAVIGREFDSALLAGSTGDAPAVVLDLLEEAVRAAVLMESSTPGVFTFAHALINHTLYQDLGLTRRAHLHRQVAEALERMCGEDVGERLGELARHWIAATTPSSPHRAIHYAQRAGEQALVQLAPDEAVRWFTEALDLLDAAPAADAAVRCQLMVGLGDAQRQLGKAEFRTTLLDAARLALEHDDTQRLVRAVLANNRGRTSGLGRVDTDRLAMVETALQREHADIADHARLTSLLALELVFDADLQRRRELSDEALRLARDSGDDRALVQVLRDRAFVIWGPGTVAERESSVAELLEAAERLGDPVAHFWALYNAVDVSVELGDISRARRHAGECTAIAAELRQPTIRWAAMVHETCLALALSPLDAVEAMAWATLEAGTASGEPDALISFAAQWGLVLIEQARWEECIPPGEKAARGFPGLPAFHASLGIQYLDAGRPDDARRVIAEAHSRGWDDIAGTPITITALSLYAETAARLSDRDTAAALDLLLAPVTEKVVWNGGVNTFNVTAYYKAVLAACLGRDVEADAGFREAIDLNTAIGAKRWCIRPRLGWAEMLSRQDHRDSQEHARSLFDIALGEAEEHGCPALAERARSGIAALR